jgi:copper chaperone CopZ
MKTLNINFLMIVLLALISSTRSYSQISKAEIRATGLTCSMCSNAINKQLKKMTEVDSVATDLNTNTFVVYLKKENTLSPMVFKESVEKAGFFVGSLEVTMASDQLKSNPNYILVDSKEVLPNEEVVVRILDKGYVTEKEHKKLLKAYSKTATFALNNEEYFHIKVVN